jgi:spore coat protein CotH
MKSPTLVIVSFFLVACGAAVASAQTQDAFFQGDSLQDIRLMISARDWHTLKANAALDTYYPADLTWNGFTVRNVGVRSRGNTTRNGVKPGLRVDFNRYLSDQQFLGLKALALDNAYSDGSLTRESVTMKMFARMGLPAPREAHARLFVNNEYAGVYVIVESIDRTFVSRVFGTAEANVERGGYLFEYQWTRPYGFEDLGSSLEAYAELFTPKTRETDSMSAIYGAIRDMVRTINDDSSADLSATREHLDVAEFVKYLAIEDFLGETDGLVGEWGLHNFYLYRFRDGRPAQLIPWDKDSTFSSAEHPIDYHLDLNVLVARAMAVPELRRIYLDTLTACASVADQPGASDPRGWLEREIDREIGLISTAVAADPVVPFSLEQFEAEADHLRQFGRLRSSFVRCQVANSLDSSSPPQACSAE